MIREVKDKVKDFACNHSDIITELIMIGTVTFLSARLGTSIGYLKCKSDILNYYLKLMAKEAGK